MSRANLAALSRIAVSSGLRIVEMPGAMLEKETALGRTYRKIAAARCNDERASIEMAELPPEYIFSIYI